MVWRPNRVLAACFQARTDEGPRTALLSYPQKKQRAPL